MPLTLEEADAANKVCKDGSGKKKTLPKQNISDCSVLSKSHASTGWYKVNWPFKACLLGCWECVD